MRKICLLGTLLATTCAGLTIPDQAVVPELTYRQRDFELGSGLRVLVQEDHSAPMVAVVSVYGVGAADDPAGQEGLAHLVEHLSFRSQANGATIGERLRQIGATSNATTSPDATTYHALAHREHLAALLDIERRRLAHTLEGITPEILAVERDVIRNERRQRGGDRGSLVDLLDRAFPGGHQLARQLGAGEASFQALSLEAAEKLVRASYRPENATIVVAGDVDPDQVGRLLAGWSRELVFGPQGPKGPPRPHLLPPETRARPPAPPRSTAVVQRRGPVSSRRMLVGWAVPPDRRGGDSVLRAALGALQIGLRVDIFGIMVAGILGGEPELLPSRDGSLILVEVGLADGEDPQKTRDLVVSAMASASGLFRARRGVGLFKWITGTTLLRQSTDLLTTALWLADYLAATGSPRFFADTLEQLASLETVAVVDFLETYVTRDRALTIVVEPDGQSTLAEGSSSQVVAGGPDATRHEVDQSGPMNLAGLGPAEIRKIAPSPNLAALPRFRLSNGLEVVALLRRRAPVTEMVVRLGVGDKSMAPFGLARMAAELSRPDCHDRDYMLEVGGRQTLVPDEIGRQHWVEVLSGNLENGLQALSNALRCRELVGGVLEARDARVRAIEKALKQPANQASYRSHEAFWAALYPNRAFGMVSRDLAALRNVDEDTLEAALRAQYRPGGALAVVVTDRPEAEVRKQLASYLERWSEPDPVPVAPAPSAPAPPTGRSLRLFPGKPGRQAHLSVGCRLPPATMETWPAYELLEAIVRREAWQVRESWGASYGLEVDVTSLPRGIAHLVITGAVDTARAGDTVVRLLGFLDQVARQGPHIKTFTLERWDLARDFVRRFSTTEGMVRAILAAANLGFPSEVWDRYPENLADLQRASVRDLLVHCPGRESIAVLGDVAEVTRQLATHALTPTP
jgi:zinc protease